MPETTEQQTTLDMTPSINNPNNEGESDVDYIPETEDEWRAARGEIPPVGKQKMYYPQQLSQAETKYVPYAVLILELEFQVIW